VHIGAYRGDHDLTADVERQLALQHNGALVLAGVGVRRDHLARRDACFDDRKRVADAIRHHHLVGYVQDGKVGDCIRSDKDLLVLLGCSRSPSAPLQRATMQ